MTGRRAAFATLVIAAVALFSYFRGSIPVVQGWGEYFWFLTYSDGLIKRGLMGSLFQALFGHATLSKQLGEVLRVHFIASMWLLLALLAWFYRCLRKETSSFAQLTLIVVFLVFATSQFLPTVAYNTGYLDVYLFCLFVAAAWLFAYDFDRGAGIIGFLGPFVHEDFIFLWASIVVLTFWRGRRTQALSYAVVGLAATAIVVLFSSVPSELAQVQALPIPADMKTATIAQLFEQSPKGALLIEVQHFEYYWRNFLIAAGFFGLAPLTIVGTYAAVRLRRFSDVALLCLAAAAPALALAVAWDLSRFLVQTTLTAMTAVLVVETRRPSELTRPVAEIPGFAILVAVIGILFPCVYAYFEVANVVGAPPFPVTQTPIAQDLADFIRTDYDPPPRATTP